MSREHSEAADGTESHLSAIQRASEVCLNETIATSSKLLGKVHQLDLDIACWIDEIDGPERAQLLEARRELGYSEYSASIGLYRQAYSALRLFLELSFAAVYFSANEWRRRRWISDRFDFSWSAALDIGDGVLSKEFIQEFTPSAAIDAPEFAKAAADTYRHCSQFIHGKARSSGSIPSSIAFSRQLIEDWCSHATSAGSAVLYLLYARYCDDLEVNRSVVLQETILDNFGHLASVRKTLELAGD